MTSFTITQESFQGPLDLLLHLIEKRKLHISDVALSQVANDYISYIKNFEHMPVSESAHFILIASTLTLIKSKALLPMLDLTEEEQTDITDLEERLKEYQKYKNLSKHIEERFNTQPMFTSKKQVHIDPTFSPEQETDVQTIRDAISRVMAHLPKVEKIAKTVVAKVMSLEEMIEKLTMRVMSSLKMSFSEFSGKGQGRALNKEEKVNVVVSFLAMLELVKEGIVSVAQQNHFDDIQIETRDVGLPRYD